MTNERVEKIIDQFLNGFITDYELFYLLCYNIRGEVFSFEDLQNEKVLLEKTNVDLNSVKKFLESSKTNLLSTVRGGIYTYECMERGYITGTKHEYLKALFDVISQDLYFLDLEHKKINVTSHFLFEKFKSNITVVEEFLLFKINDPSCKETLQVLKELCFNT